MLKRRVPQATVSGNPATKHHYTFAVFDTRRIRLEHPPVLKFTTTWFCTWVYSRFRVPPKLFAVWT